MAEVTTKICDICNVRIAVSVCEHCGKDVCIYCGNIPSFDKYNRTYETKMISEYNKDPREEQIKEKTKKSLKKEDATVVCIDCLKVLESAYQQLKQKHPNNYKRKFINSEVSESISFSIGQKILEMMKEELLLDKV